MTTDLYQPRRDVSRVALQGGYVAKRCPLRVYYGTYPPPEAVPAEVSPVAQSRMDAGNAFEVVIFEAITTQHDDVLHVPAVSDSVDQAVTMAAMRAGTAVILGGVLPIDALGRRVGKPDVLVRAERRGDTWAYHPVDVKHHQALAAPTANSSPAPVSTLADLRARYDNADRQCRRGDTINDDLLQLAHYHRMLEACGHASDERLAAVIGAEGIAVWHSLDAPRFGPRWDGMPEESPLQRYDFEFSFRLDVLAAGADGACIVEPVNTKHCVGCDWEKLCTPQLQRADSVSLLPRQNYNSWRVCQRAGVTTRAEVAALDHRSATALYGLNATNRRKAIDALDAIDGLGDEVLAATVLGRSRQFVEAGLVTVGDLRRLDPTVVALTLQVSSLPAMIDDARAVTTGNGQPHRRRGVDAVAVPAFDLEIDIDMENAIGGAVYLWGAFDGRAVTSFPDWDEPSEKMEARVFARFWEWLGRRRFETERVGQTLGLFCWNQAAEHGALRRGALAAAAHLDMTDAPAQVESLLGSGQVVDLMKVFTKQLITGSSVGLKTIAPLAGFTWQAEDAGGDASMVWHDTAVGNADETARRTAQTRLVDYNADDVQATAAVRHWIRSSAFPSITDLEPT